MGRMTDKTEAAAGRSALAPFKAAGVGALTNESLKNAASIAWGGPNWGGDPAFLAEARNEMARRGILAEYDASQISPNYSIGAILKDAVIFYGAAYGAASAAQALATSAVPTAAPVAAAPVAAAAPVVAAAPVAVLPTSASISILGVNTGIGTGVAAVDTAIGATLTGASSGAIATAAAGGSGADGAKAGAQQALLSNVAGSIKPLLPSVDLNMPRIDIPGWSNASLLDDIIKNAISGAPKPIIAAPIGSQANAVASQSGLDRSKQVGFSIDWKLLAGIVSGVVGLVSIIR